MGVVCPTCGAGVRGGAPYCASCGVTIPDSVAQAALGVDPMIGKVLARKFKIHALLGEGGMGRVYKAEQLPLNVDVVIKTLHPHLVTEHLIVQRFFREAQAASRLRHPNCVSVLDFGDSDGTLYIAMEFLRGRALGRVRDDEAPLEPKRAVRIMSQVLDVLESAHLMNIIHRDLKPDNIMLEDLPTRRDFAKVLDFGIAKILDPMGRNEKLTQTGMIFGTPSYMAPEQAMANDVDARTDLYAVGVLLFELLTKRLPITAPSVPQLLVAVISKAPPPLQSIRPDLPARLCAVVDTALSKQADQRFQSAAEMKMALEASIETTLTPAVVPIPEIKTVVSESPFAEVKPCPRCGATMNVTAKFCAECGASTTAQISGLHDLRRFLPSGIIDEIAEMRVRGASEKRELVVLVVDLGGDVFQGTGDQVKELYGQLVDAAMRRGGVFERRPGGTLVVFGLTLAHADEAERAVATALEMRELVTRFVERQQVVAEMTFVIHGGHAVVETTQQGPAYTPVGDLLELPTRIAGVASTGKILVTEYVEKHVRHVVQLGALRAVSLKGRTAAVPTFEVSDVPAAAVVPHAALSRPPTVGREEAIEAILGYTGPCVLVLGEPGIGKSRLLEEVAVRLARKRQLAVDRPARDGPPSRPGLYAIWAPARPDANRVSPVLAQIVETLGGTTDELRARGLETDDARLVMRASQRHTGDALDHTNQLAVAAVLRVVLERIAARSPVVILIDDAHLADTLTTQLIVNWTRDPIPHVTVVATARTGNAVVGLTDPRTATLAGLEPGAIAQLVDGALAPANVPPNLREAVIARAAGSPLMALEVLRAMIDGGIIASLGGRWTVTGDPASLSTPAGLKALYGARIDALPTPTRDALACAAVIAVDIPIVVLDRVIGTAHPTLQLDRTRNELIVRGLLAVGDSPERLQFPEPSAREVAYERLMRDARRDLHRQVAEAFEALRIRVAEEVIGEHYELGADYAKALDWYQRACDAAMRLREHQRAVGVLKRSRDAARALGDLRSNRRLAEDSLKLTELLVDLGDLTTARDVIAEGLACAHKEDDPVLICRTRRARGRMFIAAAKLDDANTDLDGALASAVGIRDKLLIGELHGDLGELAEKRGDLVNAIEYTMRALELVQGHGAADVQRVLLRLLLGLGRMSVRDKQLDRAERFLKQALDIATATSDKLSAAKVLGNLAAVWHARGDFATAIELATKALELSRELGDLIGSARQLTNLGTLSSMRGDHNSALRHLDTAYALAQRIGWREGMASAAAARDRINSTRRPAR